MSHVNKGRRVLSPAEVARLRADYWAGVRPAELAERYGISWRTAIRIGRRIKLALIPDLSANRTDLAENRTRQHS